MQHFSQHTEAKMISSEYGTVVPLRKCSAVTWVPRSLLWTSLLSWL